MDFKPTIKQHILFEVFGDHKYLEILYGGSAGGGKSYGVWALMIMKCLEYKGIRIGLARQTMEQIKKHSIVTFHEVIRDFEITEDYYKYNENKGLITFYNGSVIQFFELSYLPSLDPNYDRFGGALLTFGVIEEAAGCDWRGKDIFSSRLGRWLNDRYNIPEHLYMTCNPGTNFVYNDFYLPWTRNELAEHRLYIPAKLSDNEYIGKGYESSLRRRLDINSANRLLSGDWNFDADKSRLITWDKCNEIYNNYDSSNWDKLERYLTADIAFTGDKCIMIIWFGLNVKRIIHYKGDEPDLEIVRLCDEWGISINNVAYDADGVGKYLSGKLSEAYGINNNGTPIGRENFKNLKSQLYFKLAEMVNDELVKVEDISFRKELVQELYEVKTPPVDTIEGKMSILSKDKIKAVIGRSPDISDAMAFRMVFELTKEDDFYMGFA